MSGVLACHQPNFAPWLGYFHKASQVDIFVIQDDAQFTKKDWINRVAVKNRLGVSSLVDPIRARSLITCPVVKAPTKTPINEVKYAEGGWRDKHWKTLKYTYKRAEFWEKYSSDISRMIFNRSNDLVKYNMPFIYWLLEHMKIDAKIVYSSAYPSKKKASNRLAELCDELGCDEYLSGVGAKNYLKMRPFQDIGVAVRYQEFQHPIYGQVHGEFVKGLSALDALFNVGPRMGEMLLS